VKPRKSKRPGYTPSFPALRDELIPPVSAKGETPAVTTAPGSFLPGFSCAGGDPKAPALSKRGRKFYETFMASAVWAAKKAPILTRAGGQCERCGCKGTVLEVHHRNYDRFGGDELPSDLEALCPACHAIADAERRAEVCAAIERRREEAEEALDDARFAGWLRKVKGYDDPRDAGNDLEWLREEFDEWCRDREGDDYE
jgi:5-methylcytosine-specific restriction endonuclease McrA